MHLILPMPLASSRRGRGAAAKRSYRCQAAHQGFRPSIFGLTCWRGPRSTRRTVIGAGAVAGGITGAAVVAFAGWSLTHGYGYWPMFAILAGAYLTALLWVHLLLPVIRPAHA
jgi:ACS family hexuronate transporter-like MFS transporter